MIHSPFIPWRGQNIVVSPAAGSAVSTIGKGAKSIRFVNSGTNICYVRIGSAVSAASATTADTPILPGGYAILGKFQDDDTVAYISAAGTTLNIQPGEGGYY